MAIEQLVSKAGQDWADSAEVLSTQEPNETMTPISNDSRPGALVPGFAFDLASNPFGHYCIPKDMADTTEAQVICRASVYEAATIQLISRKLGRGDMVTGCLGIGSFLPALHDALAPNAMIHAFEPGETAFEATSFTAHLNGLERVNLHKVIAGKRNRLIPVSKLSALQLDQAPDVPIQMNTLDSLVPQGRYVSVVHLSMRGREVQALLGARRIVHDCAPLILMKAPDEKTRRFQTTCLEAHFPELRYQSAGEMDGNSVYVPLNRD